MLSRPARLRMSALHWLQLLVALSVLWAAVFYIDRGSRQEALAATETRAMMLARSYAEHSLASFQRIDLMLEGLRHEWVDDPDNFLSEVLRYQWLIRDMAFQIAVLDAAGQLAFTNLAWDGVPLDLSGREHFQVPHARSQVGMDRLYVSSPLRERISDKWGLQLTRPIFGAGEFRGVAVVSVDPAYFARYYETIGAGPGDVVTMVRDTGEILARAPDNARFLGKKLSGTPYLQANAPLAGHFLRVAQTDGVQRIYGYYRLPALEVTLVAGLGTDAALAEVDAQRLRLVLLALVLSSALILLALINHRAQQARGRAERALAASEGRFRTLFDCFAETVFVVDTECRFQMVHFPRDYVAGNASVAAWRGRTLEQMLPADLAGIMGATARRVMQGGGTQLLEFCASLTGQARYYRASVTALDASDHQPAAAIFVIHDVTDARQAAEELRIAATTFESQEGMLITDAHGVILRVNKAFVDLTGYPAEEVVGRTPAVLRSGRQGDAFYAAMWTALKEDGYWQGEIWNRRKSGENYPEWLTITAVRDETGETSHFVGAFSDITEHKAAEMQIRHLAFYDPLTKLANRRLLRDRLEQAMVTSQRSGAWGALLYLDLDHFKILNDTRGHDAGDTLLVEVATRLCAAVREEDTVARLGGDEFMVMLERLHGEAAEAASQAANIAEKIRASLCAPFLLSEEPYHLSSSIGVCLFQGGGTGADELTKQADLALYEAKEAGRNLVRFFNATMQEAVAARAVLQTELRQALSNGEFELYLQPQVALSGRLLGAEALLRWHHPQHGLLAPGLFIGEAEQSGLILPIGDWVLESACQILVAWANDPLLADLLLSVNVSARQFHHPDFISKLARCLTVSGANPLRLRLELTESAVLEDVDLMRERMAQVRALGATLSLDDFGTGYSSLSNLKNLPVSEVKIDRSFVRDIATDPQDAAIIRAILAMAGSFGITVIAEGVEEASQQHALEAFGCRHFQGYLHGRPQPEADFQVWAEGLLHQ